MDIIMSIHPKWAQLIYSGQKTIELRKTMPRVIPGKVWIYETAPVKRITGWFRVLKYERMISDYLLSNNYSAKDIREKACIEKWELEQYTGFWPAKEIIASFILEVQKNEPIPLPPGIRAPQSWCYLKENGQN